MVQIDGLEDPSMELEPVSGTIGALVRGVDLSAPIGEPLADALIAALDVHLVLFLEAQRIDRAALKRATESFGRLLRVPYVSPLPDDPDVIAVLKEADEANISNFGGTWHSDFSFLPEPPGGSLLYAIETPPYGGDTLWSNQIVAWETLPDELRQILEHRRAVHTGAPYGIKHRPDGALRLSASIRMKRNDPQADRECLHPAVRTHPRSGRKALFINPIYTVRLEGMSVEESRPVLSSVYRHATQPEFTCRFRWHPGSLAIWDNRTTMHYGLNDYDGFRRLLYRTTFVGEQPF